MSQTREETWQGRNALGWEGEREEEVKEGKREERKRKAGNEAVLAGTAGDWNVG